MFIAPSELKEKLQEKEDIFLLDVRTPEEYNNWKIEEAVNIPVNEVISSLEKIPKEKEIITICAHGQRSQFAENILKANGFNAKTLSGGMALWNSVFDFVEIKSVKSDFKLFQIKRVGKGCLGYFLVSGNQAAVIDPSIYTQEYLDFSKKLGCQIKAIIDTHQQADHISGSRFLQKESKADLFLNSLDVYGVQGYKKLDENKKIVLGNIEIEIIQTPGHTRGSTSFLIDNKFLLTGDTLFIEGVARPDLKDKSEEYAAELFETYRNKILNLDGNLIIVSAHCKNASDFGKPVAASLDWITKNNKIFELSKPEFIKYVVSNIPPKPLNYETIVNTNKNGLEYTEDEVSELEFGANRCVVATSKKQ